MNVPKICYPILILIFSFAISSAEIYKWVDENGVTHYSDSPTHNIPESAETEDDDNPSAELPSAAQPPAAKESHKGTLEPGFFDILDEPQEEALAAKKPTVEIYETSWCGYCKKAKNFFRSRGIDFVAYDIEKDPQAARRMRSMTKTRAVPFVVINGQGIEGYSEQAYARALEQ